ncbi:BRO family protein [Rothia nasimurium]|uniref:BRO family protein n=1 Tax=Rothia nasimurium TaxID=85336 RepID=UPI001EFFDA54|nr:BRO family protein [Rothia nasimurium]
MEILSNNNAHADVQTFDFNGLTLRALLVEGEPWFVLADLVKALGLTNASVVANRLREKGVSKTYTPTAGGRQLTTIIDEGNLYRVIMRSNSPAAEPFESWVTDDVLPAIRKTGAYEKPKTEAEKVLEVFELLRAQAEESRRELEVARPKAEVYDKILTPEHTFGFRDLCKSLREHFPVNEADVKRVLREKKILTPGFRLDVYSAAIDKGYAVRHPSGKWGGKERFQPRFTTKTLEWLLAELAPLEEVA